MIKKFGVLKRSKIVNIILIDDNDELAAKPEYIDIPDFVTVGFKLSKTGEWIHTSGRYYDPTIELLKENGTYLDEDTIDEILAEL